MIARGWGSGMGINGLMGEEFHFAEMEMFWN